MSQASSELETQLRDLVVRARGTGDLLPTLRRETTAALTAHRTNGSSAAFFNVLLFNANPFDPCPFVFTIFRVDSVAFFAGHGPPAPIVEFCDTLDLTEVDALEAALRGLKPALLAMTAPRSVVEEWLAS